MNSGGSSQNSDIGWISWFCSLEEHQFLCEVEEEFIKDSFNIYGLREIFPNYKAALELILSSDYPEDEQLEDQKYLELYQEATDLYGLIHARYIISSSTGLELMKDKYLSQKFGVCPRVLCERQPVLPIGMSEELRTSRVKIYCPRCQDVYISKKKSLDQCDGSYFGCSFPNIFLMTYPDLVPKPLTTVFVPRLNGFRLYKKKGSKFLTEQDKSKKEILEITYYGKEELQKLKERLTNVSPFQNNQNINEQQGIQQTQQQTQSSYNNQQQQFNNTQQQQQYPNSQIYQFQTINNNFNDNFQQETNIQQSYNKQQQ